MKRVIFNVEAEFLVKNEDYERRTKKKTKADNKWLNKWQKLKEWLEEKKSRNERRLKEAPINTEFYIQVSVQGITINKILTIMQKLEGEDVKD